MLRRHRGTAGRDRLADGGGSRDEGPNHQCQSRVDRTRRTQEPVLGAAGLALLVSAQPRIVELDAGWNGVYAHEVADISSSPGDRDRRRRREPPVVSRCGGAHLRRLCRAGRAGRGLRSILRRQHVPRAIRWSRPACAFSARATRAGFVEGRGRVSLGQEVQAVTDLQPPHRRRLRSGHLRRARRADRCHAVVRAGDRVGIYSYGSGSCAEFYSATIGAEDAWRWPRRASTSSCRTGMASP